MRGKSWKEEGEERDDRKSDGGLLGWVLVRRGRCGVTRGGEGNVEEKAVGYNGGGSVWRAVLLSLSIG